MATTGTIRCVRPFEGYDWYPVVASFEITEETKRSLYEQYAPTFDPYYDEYTRVLIEYHPGWKTCPTWCEISLAIWWRLHAEVHRHE